MVKIRPLDDRVVLQILDAEEVTLGGIVLPDTAQEKPQRGKVAAVGEGSRTKSGERIKPDVEKGDTVLFGKYAGTDIQIDGEEYKIVRENEILAKLGS